VVGKFHIVVNDPQNYNTSLLHIYKEKQVEELKTNHLHRQVKVLAFQPVVKRLFQD